jgi:hypothetical protein
MADSPLAAAVEAECFPAVLPLQSGRTLWLSVVAVASRALGAQVPYLEFLPAAVALVVMRS